MNELINELEAFSYLLIRVPGCSLCSLLVGVSRGVNGTDIIRPYFSSDPFGRVKIRSVFESGHLIFDPYPYPSTQSWINMMLITIQVLSDTFDQYPYPKKI